MIKIIDNVTTPANASYFEFLLMDQHWSYIRSTAYNQYEQPKKPYDPSWVCMMYNHEEVINPLMYLAQSILLKALYEQNMSISKLIRIRAGLTTRTPYPVIHAPHVDWDNEHMTALYYVNDADGDTVFYNETRDPNLDISSFEWGKDKQFTVAQTVTPKADRLVIFDGSRFHSSTTSCNTDYRLIINYNWLP